MIGQLTGIRRYLVTLMVVWTLAVGVSLLFTLNQHIQAFYTVVHTQAKAIHTMEMAVRNWVIKHGGVYVPATEQTSPSQYMKDIPERDVVTSSGKVLTLINSSYMTRQVLQLMAQNDATVRGHVASLMPVNPVNRADPWETVALKAFERGQTEATGIEILADGKTYYRLMQPMITEKACLKCHARQGYKIGDVRGGLSVSIPIDSTLAAEDKETQMLLLGHGGIWGLGMIALFIGARGQQKAVLEVKKSEAEVRLLTNSIVHAIYGQDLNGICTFANAACVSMLGYEREEQLLGKDLYALIHHSKTDGTPYPASECPTHRSIKEGRELHIEEECLWRSDGSCFPAEYWSYPMVKNGRCLGAVVTFLDLSEQKRIGNELKRSQKLLDSIVEHVPAMIFLKSTDDLRFELINRAGEHLLGYARQDILGRNDYDFFSQQQADAFIQNDKAVLDSHKQQEIPEERIKTAGGEEKWLHTYKIGLYDEQQRATHLLGISMDITARKQVELNLEKSRLNLADAQRIAHIGSWEVDLIGNTLYWSDEIYRMLEIEPDVSTPSSELFLESIHPEDRSSVRQAYADSIQNRMPLRIEYRLLMKDGRVKFVLEHCETVFDENGGALHSTGTVQDVSRRKWAETALRESKERYDDMVERIPVGIYLYRFKADGEACFDYVSPRFCRILGLDEADILRDARVAFSAAHPDDLDSLLRANAQALRRQQPFRWEGRFIVGGDIRWVEIESEPTPLASGDTLWNGVISDISERKLAQLALSENEERFRSITSAANDAIIVMDIEGNVCFWNSAAESMFGYSQDEALGKDLHDLLVPARYHEAFRKGFAQFKVTGAGPVIGRQLEVTGLRKGGEEFPLELSVAASMVHGKRNAIGVIRDISERKQAETALEHANRALQTLSMVNRELVHASEENALLQGICSVIVEQQGYKMAWVGYLQHDALKSIRIMASSGDTQDLLSLVHPSWAEDAVGFGLCGRAVYSEQTQISADIASDRSYQAWGKELVRQGCAASIALPLKTDDAVFGILHVYAEEVNAFTDREIALLEEMADDLAFGVQTLRIKQERDNAMQLNEDHLAQMHTVLQQTIVAISKAVEARDPYTAGHQRRVAELACVIAERMGLDQDRIEGIRMGATIHDIGKIQVPVEILSKPTRLTDIEFTVIKLHPKVGYEILEDVHFPWPVAEIAYSHHERMDGSGYPLGLKGEEICLEARIVAVADVIEAMSSDRPYRPGLGIDVALAEIRKNSGTYYDAQVVDACLALFADGYQLQ